jgi:GABA permease
MAIILASLLIVNFLAVRAFGEIEYWLSVVKIVAIIFFLCVSIYVLIKKQPGSSNYDKAGGPFLGKSFGGATVNIIGTFYLF